MLIMIVVPVIEAIAFWGLLRRPAPLAASASQVAITDDDKDHEMTNSANDLETSQRELNEDERPLIGVREKIKYVPKLFKYMIPLTLVYFLEYFINQGLVRCIYDLNNFLIIYLF